MGKCPVCGQLAAMAYNAVDEEYYLDCINDHHFVVDGTDETGLYEELEEDQRKLEEDQLEKEDK